VRILVVEDDKTTREFVARALVESGFVVDATGLGHPAEEMALERPYDVLVVDLILPDRDGLELIQRLRAQGVKTPILVLSARRGVNERVLGLETGADDYMTKPFALAELLARVRTLLRRSAPAQVEATRLRVRDLELDLIRRQVRRNGTEIQLTQQEFGLLEYLLRNVGRVVTRTMLLDEVWKMRIGVATNVVDVYIHRLRSKVDTDDQRPLIRTIQGVGYVLTE
jgi:DNA-binding response OmpR family regulator